MKGASLALLGILAALHWREGDGATAVPLSMFRDGDHAWLGYSAFALLILMGVVMTHAAYRCRESLTCVVYAGAIVMLIAIVATPSVDPLHVLISLVLPFIFYVFYLKLLHSLVRFLMLVHLAAPVLMLFAIQFHSYGAWQKSMMMYFVLLANFHYGLLPHPVRRNAHRRPTRGMNRDLERLIAEGWIDRKAFPSPSGVLPVGNRECRTALPGRLHLLTARKGRPTWHIPPLNGCTPERRLPTFAVDHGPETG
jgi:hypothetical protein